jgi:hypothetical protein
VVVDDRHLLVVVAGVEGEDRLPERRALLRDGAG